MAQPRDARTPRRAGGDPRPANGLRLRLLGGFTLECNGAPVPLRLNSQRLTAFLGIRGRASRGVVAQSLWPHADAPHAHGSLRTALWRVQRTAPDLITVTADLLALDPEVQVDVREVAARTHQAASAPVGGPPITAPAVGAVELLPGWYDDWVLHERERLRHVRMHALENVAARHIDSGRCAEALEAALEAVRLEPLRESAHRFVIAAHLADDNVAEAVRHYSLLHRLLQHDLGVEPSEATRAMLRNRVPGHHWQRPP